MEKIPRERIRNFCIIAHVDHGKTTLSDRLLQITGTVVESKLQNQMLDSMDLERERGITIKAHPVTMTYFYPKDKQYYQLNLIDTPGHVDFSYEVSRSLSACEGALLVIDATQGIQAQTVSNVFLAEKHNLVLIPVINKIDLPTANPELVKKQLEEILAIPADTAILASGKEGIGIDEILQAIIRHIPPPQAFPDQILRALIFDSVYDPFKGVILYVRMFSGKIKKGEKILLLSTKKSYEVKEVGIFNPKMVPEEELYEGNSGYVIANIKDPSEIKIGDTITWETGGTTSPLPGFQEIVPMVFSGIYPLNSSEFEKLKNAIQKLQINDPAITISQESSVALGSGFRCGFLGLLHMEIVQERLRREYGVDILTTYPSVVYKVYLRSGEILEVDNPSKLPDPSTIEHIAEPLVKAYLIVPSENIGELMQLISEKRGSCETTETLDQNMVILHCLFPLNEILVDFNDKLKSITHGYGSMDYKPAGYRISDLVKLDILVNGEPIEALSCIVHASKAESRGRAIIQKLKERIPRHLFKIALQAAIGSKIIAREDIGAIGKNVTAKCYGGDITRKRKLLEKQKEGKKRMKTFGKVDIPQEAFLEILKTDVKQS
ncbi:GTP-binding protein LepA [Methylacidiphilum kamchatkense Kam1]|uniref:Elongation factor 4 n=1 Tax=Methylacidiphilum kamchatkense Kam1 TaxID=1202785 RepID=A0A0C1UTD5_9BACT|nr:translation elongation factor 4 [Methylacidiphilum kamchatkense]KIE59073.1 GTP-binding protein LepA [Methylacidiphilum kamchatkense Kam1]QDQ43017.1 GTP-binding protein LepA [Methylacidiphilum kamchatkense Kam1]